MEVVGSASRKIQGVLAWFGSAGGVWHGECFRERGVVHQGEHGEQGGDDGKWPLKTRKARKYWVGFLGDGNTKVELQTSRLAGRPIGRPPDSESGYGGSSPSPRNS